MFFESVYLIFGLTIVFVVVFFIQLLCVFLLVEAKKPFSKFKTLPSDASSGDFFLCQDCGKAQRFTSSPTGLKCECGGSFCGGTTCARVASLNYQFQQDFDFFDSKLSGSPC